MQKALNWSRKFKSIALKDGRAIASLREARDFMDLLSPALRAAGHWKYADELLLKAADRNEKYSTMDARAQMARALKIDGLSCSNAPAASIRQPARLLIVEDEFIVASVIAGQLAELGHKVAGPACSLGEALRLASVAEIDGALLDWKLDGVATGGVADILARRGIPFFFVTGNGGALEEAYSHVAILNKPFKIGDLQRTLETVLPKA